MGNRLLTALTAIVVSASAGCQGIRDGSFFSVKSSPAAGPPTQLVPPLVQNNLNGNGVGDAELPKDKKILACVTAAQQMEAAGKFGEAAYYYDQLRQLEPKKEYQYTRRLAVMYDRKGDFDKALDEYQRAIRLQPKDAEAYNDLGYGYYTRGHWESAEKHLRKAVEIDPKSKRAWSNLGLCYAQLGRYEESLKAFEKVVNRPQALCNIGFIQTAQGKRAEARETYAYAIQLEPGLQKARLALSKLDEFPSKTAKERDLAEMKARGRALRDHAARTASGPGASMIVSETDVPASTIVQTVATTDRPYADVALPEPAPGLFAPNGAGYTSLPPPPAAIGSSAPGVR